MPYRHTVLFDDSLNLLWQSHVHNGHLDHRFNHSFKGASGGSATCARSLRVVLNGPDGHVRIHSDAPVHGALALSLQFWVRGPYTAARCNGGAASSSVGGWVCGSSVACLSMLSSAAAPSSVRFVPLCAFGAMAAHEWRKLVVPVSAFSATLGERQRFDEVVLLAGVQAGRAVELLLDDVMLMSAARPPAVLPTNLLGTRPSAPTKRMAGRCVYMSGRSPSSEDDSRRSRLLPARAAAAPAPACRMDGDHLDGRWVQNCAPEDIRRPDRYAYGRSVGRPVGPYDYRLCYQMGYAERQRSRAALSWSWQPHRCSMAAFDAERFDEWLGDRLMLFWGDSLTAQHFYSLVLLLGTRVTSLSDVASSTSPPHSPQPPQPPQPRHQRQPQAAPPASDVCDYEGLGSEGGGGADSSGAGSTYTLARLKHGGRIVKVLGHVEMVGEAQAFDAAWWRHWWREADFVIFNLVGHHLRALDASFTGYPALVRRMVRQMAANTRKSTRLVMRTTNLGHDRCVSDLRPLHSRAEAWRRLGGWDWRPPGFASAPYFGAPRDGTDRYDWRAPALAEVEWLRRGVTSALGSRLVVLNVSHVDMRADGHVGNAMRYHTDPTKANGAADCLHYCLPGPADAWSVALYNLLLRPAPAGHTAPLPPQATSARHGGASRRKLSGGASRAMGGAPRSTGGRGTGGRGTGVASRGMGGGGTHAGRKTVSHGSMATGGRHGGIRAGHDGESAPSRRLAAQSDLEEAAATADAELCERLVACERAGRVWQGELMAASAVDGRWTASCAKTFPSSHRACERRAGGRRRRRLIFVFTHLPKAGGSSVGAALSSAAAAHSPLESCHLLWNGLDAATICPRILTWISRPRTRLAPPLPFPVPARDGSWVRAAAAQANASLASAVPFRHCRLIWAQHVDYSMVEAVEAAHPRWRVRPIMFVRHPVRLFFSEFLYKRHCLWRQQGRDKPPPDVPRTLAEHISQLVASPARRMPLTAFLAGASWCSCAADRVSRQRAGGWQLHRAARANAARYAFIGTVERFNESM